MCRLTIQFSLSPAGKALTLPRDQWESIGKLPTGQAIVKIQDRWPKPFLVRFPLFPVSGSPEASHDKREHSRSDSLRRAVQEARSVLNEAVRALPDTDTGEKKKEGTSAGERDFLTDIAEYPLSVVTERYGRLKMSVHKGNSIKQKLLVKGLIEQENIRVPKGRVTLLKLSDKGKNLMGSIGAKIKPMPKNASLQHEYYKELVARQYRSKGYDVKKEVPIGQGRAVDLVATKGDERIAIEIKTGKSDIEANVRKCKEAGFSCINVIKTRKFDS